MEGSSAAFFIIIMLILLMLFLFSSANISETAEKLEEYAKSHPDMERISTTLDARLKTLTFTITEVDNEKPEVFKMGQKTTYCIPSGTHMLKINYNNSLPSMGGALGAAIAWGTAESGERKLAVVLEPSKSYELKAFKENNTFFLDPIER